MINSIYKAIEKNSIGLIKNFDEDLTKHDFNTIKKHGDTKPFIHITRESGTALCLFFKLEDYPKEGETVKGFFNTPTNSKQIIEGQRIYFDHYYKNYPLLFQYFDGLKVQKISKDKARLIFETYIDSLKTRIASIQEEARREEDKFQMQLKAARSKRLQATV